MWRWTGSCLAAVALLISGETRDAGGAPSAYRLIAHFGEPTPIIPIVPGGGDNPRSKGETRVSLGGTIWNTAVAPGGKFALLHTSAEPWINGLLVLALPEGRIVRALPAPEVRVDEQAFAISADGRWGLFAGDEHDVIVWDTVRAREIGRLKGAHDERVTATAISSDGRAALTGDENGGAALWSMPDRKLRHRFNVDHHVRTAAFSPDGRRAIAVGRHATMVDVKTRKEVLSLHGHGPFTRVAFTPDGKRLVLASSYDHVMTVSDAATGRLLQLRKKDPIPDEIAMAPDGRSVLGQGHSEIQRWHLDDLGKVDTLGQFGFKSTGIGVGAGGRMFFTTDESGSLRLWDAATGKRLPSRTSRAVETLAWTPDGAMLVAGAADGTLTVWSGSGKRLHQSTRHENTIQAIAISRDGKLAATVAGDAALWPLPTGPERAIGGAEDGIELEWAAFSADGKRVFVGGENGDWASAGVANPGKLSAKACNGVWSGDTAVALDHGRAVLAAVSSWSTPPHSGPDSDARGATLARVNLETCKPVWSEGGPARTALAVSPDGKRGLAADRKGGLELFNLETGATIRELVDDKPARAADRGGGGDEDEDDYDDEDGGPGARSFALGFLGEKDRAMTGNAAGGLTVWNLATGKVISRIGELRKRKAYATAIAAKPGGRAVAVGTSRGEVLVFAP